MSRPDGLAADYEYPVFDARDYAHNIPQGLPGQGPYHAADLQRDLWSRREQVPPRDHAANRDSSPSSTGPAFYHTPPTPASSAQISSLSGTQNGSRTLSGMIAPRMYGAGTAAQAGVLT